MAYHEAFWLVTGTAAPVIALAVIVSAQESRSVTRSAQSAVFFPEDFSFLNDKDDDEDRRTWKRLMVRRIRRQSQLSYWAALVNLAVQGALLAISLVSIDGAANCVPPWLAIVLAVGGMFFLVLISLSAASAARYWQMLTRGWELLPRTLNDAAAAGM